MRTPLTIVTYNVCSLGLGKQGVKKRCNIRNYMRRAESKPNVILLQETHMGIRECATLTSQLHFKGGQEFWSEAKFSATTCKYTGGIGILVVERLIPHIEDHGVLIGSRAQYVMLRFSPQVKIGIINIYGYNQPAARVSMWRKYADLNLPQVD